MLRTMKAAARRLLRDDPRLMMALRALRWKMGHGLEAETRLVPFLAARGRPALDVGAAVGVYSHVLLPLCSRLIAMEPNPDFARALAAHFGGRITLIEAAASDVSGRTTLHRPRDGSLYGMGTVERGNPVAGVADVERFDVATVRIDDLGLEDLGFVKIDVEGHELAVVEGALATIERFRPTLLIEIEERHRPNAVASVRALLESRDYVGFMLIDGALRSIATFDPAVHQKVPDDAADRLNQGIHGDEYINNFVFLPR
ncbi:MAG: FkbM family methyltransferase [Hyphomicrobiales bacterium]|nr:FkbM family methyltransferase [Hyphomicrobiales bacterium]